ENFHPDRMADRILGMGDIVSLVEEMQEKIDASQAEKTSRRMQQGLFDLNDMLSLMKQMNRLGPLKKILMMLPNMPKMDDDQVDAAQAMLKKTEVIINSMTRQERKKPEIIKTSRKIRIAKGAGVQPNEVTKLVESFDTMKKQMANMQRNPMAARMMMSQFKKR
ncbi:MAG: signal recognition particle protein, partial [Bacilli bacterium]|nr:signal recognition particle protein [Bacilli bacterium]